MKKNVRVFFAAIGFALSSFAFLLFAPSAYAQEHFNFDPQARKDIEVELGCGEVYSVSLGGLQLKPHEYSFSSGVLTIHKPFLLGLAPGVHYLKAQTDAGEANFSVEVAKVKAASLKDDFGNPSPDGYGWQYLYSANCSFLSDIEDFIREYDLFALEESWPSTGNVTAWRNLDLGIGIGQDTVWVNWKNLVALKWKPRAAGRFAIEYSLKDLIGKYGMIGFYRDGQPLLPLPEALGELGSKSGSLSVELSAGQSLYIAFQPYDERELNIRWQAAVEIYSSPYAVQFVDGDYTYTQYVYPSQFAEYFEPKRDGGRFIGWFLDEGMTVPYDFGSPVTADLVLYAG